MTVLVRPGVVQDIDWLISQLRIFSEHYGTKRSLFGDEAYARVGLKEMMEKHVLFIAERHEPGRPEVTPTQMGFIAGVVTQHMFNPSIRYLAETFWWVAEEYRGTRAALLLMEEFLEWGKRNADWITFALEATSPVKDSALTRRGFHLHERAFLLETG